MANIKVDIYTLDVWGNEEDGFDVNDKNKICTKEIAEEIVADNEKLITYLKDDILNRMMDFEVIYESYDTIGYIMIGLKDTHEPILELIY